MKRHRVVRNGLTFIELIVVIAVTGLLLAILLPAVQHAREGARRAQCKSNLKNLGLALQLHHEARGAFPAGLGGRPLGGSYLIQLLPFLEMEAMFHSLNMNADAFSNENFTALTMAPSIYTCPSDPGLKQLDTGQAVNYAGNGGNSLFDGNGMFYSRPVRAQEITDGLSQTTGIAEWITGPGFGKVGDRQRQKFSLQQRFTTTSVDLEAFKAACRVVEMGDGDPHAITGSKGQFWLHGSYAASLYNHTLTPNLPSCSALQDMDATTAGSYHPGGAQVLTMDGSVHFIKDSIAQSIWTSLGSRSDGEAVSSDLLDERQ